MSLKNYQKQSLKKRSFTRDRGVSFFNADAVNQNLNYTESGSRLIFIDVKKIKYLEDGSIVRN